MDTALNRGVRKVHFPIKGKLILVISSLLLLSLSIYAYYALNHFKQDKSAYIFESTLAHNSSTAAVIAAEVSGARHDMSLLGDAFNLKNRNLNFIKNLFEKNPNIIQFKIIDAASNEVLFSLKDGNFAKSNSLDKNFFEKTDSLENVPYEKLVNEKYLIGPMDGVGENPVVWIGDFDKKFNQFRTAKVALMRVRDLIDEAKNFSTLIYNEDGTLLINSKSSLSLEVKRILKAERKEVSKIDNKIVAIQKDPLLKLITVSTIDYELAFSAANYIISRSVYFALFLLSLTIIVAIIFSRNLTAPIEILHQGLKRFGQGDFDFKLKINSNDEIGALSDSFNYMSKEILGYMDEMKEKIRLEKEVEVAQLVQSSFLPPKNLNLNGFDIASFYSPASECGGDWWGYLEADDRLVVFIADATGHGVPAALLTATANSTISFFKELMKTNPAILDSPANMMSLVNQVVCDAGSQIQMTFFIGVLEKRSGRFIYSSASHNPPFLVKGGESLGKENFIPLLSEPGPHLGKSVDSSYINSEIAASREDTLVLFTDGILECENKEKKPYGQRRFIKSIAASLGAGLFSARDKIASDAFEFYEGVEPDDDLTFILLGLSRANEGDKFFNDFKIHLKTNEALINSCINSIDVEKADFIIIDEAALKSLSTDVLASKNIFVLTMKSNADNIEKILGQFNINHIFGLNSPNIIDELKIVLANYKDNDGNYGEVLSEVRIVDSIKAIDSVRDDLMKIDFSSIFDSSNQYLETLANEMISNAIYNVGDHEKTNRAIKLKLSENEEVLFRISKRGEDYILSVKDKFGTLNRDKIISKLLRAVRDMKPEDKLGGAGLGLYVMYNFSNQLIFDVKEGEYTWVHCVIEGFKRYRDYRSRITSFHFYERN